MSEGLLVPIVGLWVLSFALYVAAGLLMWKRRVHRTVHILMTVAAFVADIVALTMQKIHMMQVGRSILDVAPALRTAQGATQDLSMALYCVVALLGFSRIMGWHKPGRWHVPVAVLFMANWLLARYFIWLVVR